MGIVSVVATYNTSLTWSRTETTSTKDSSKIITDLGGLSFASVFSTGNSTDSGVVNRAWQSEGSIPTGSSVSFSLSSGLNQNIFGETNDSSFSNIRAINIVNTFDGVSGAPISGALTVSSTGVGAMTDFWGSGLITIPRKSSFSVSSFISGVNITSGNDTFQINDRDNVGSSYSISIVGISGG